MKKLFQIFYDFDERCCYCLAETEEEARNKFMNAYEWMELDPEMVFIECKHGDFLP